VIRGGARCLWRVKLEKKKVLRLERNNDRVMDDKSGDFSVLGLIRLITVCFLIFFIFFLVPFKTFLVFF